MASNSILQLLVATDADSLHCSASGTHSDDSWSPLLKQAMNDHPDIAAWGNGRGRSSANGGYGGGGFGNSRGGAWGNGGSGFFNALYGGEPPTGDQPYRLYHRVNLVIR